jgi:hypothetical protein
MAISVGSAVGAGFNLIGRRPLALVGWGLASLILGLGVLLTVGGAMFATLASIRQSAAGGAVTDPRAVLAAVGGVAGTFVLLVPVELIFLSVLCCAAYRSVLEPDNSRFAYLRLGGQELWVLLTFVVEAVLFLVYYLGCGIVIAILAGVGSIAGSGGIVAVLLAIVGVFATLAGLVYLGLRFSLAGPATFAERRFALFSSWTLTRGNVGSLFLVGLVIVVSLFGIVIIQGVLNMILDLGAAGGGMSFLKTGDPTAIREAFSNPSALFARLGPVFVVEALISGVVQALLTAVSIAPWAEAYRELKPGPELAQTFA